MRQKPARARLGMRLIMVKRICLKAKREWVYGHRAPIERVHAYSERWLV